MRDGHEGIYKFGTFRLDSAERSLRRGEELVPLTAKVFDLLLYLVGNAGRLVTKEELMREIWPDAFVEENNLTVNMSALRKSLSEGGRGGSHIETVSGRGYRFTTKVRIVKSHKGARENRRGNGAGDSLAVLPLENMTADPVFDYLSDGIAESIIGKLSQLPQLKVMAWNAVRGFTRRDADAQTVGHKLGVRAVLVGRVLGSGDGLRVAMELVDAGDGSRVWGTQYEYEHGDILSLQEDIARRVVEGLRIRLTAGERRGLNKQHTSSIKAYQFYLQGRHSWNKRTVDGFREALGFFERALKEDGSFSLAHTGVADSYLLLGGFGAISPQESIPRIKTALAMALEQDEELAEAHASLGHLKTLHEWDWAGAEREFRLAIKLNPNYATAHHWYASSLRSRGLVERAREELKLAQQFDPLSAMIDTAIGATAYYARQYDEAISHLRGTLELHPNFYVASAHLGLCYLAQGAYEDAIREFRPIASETNDPEALGILGHSFGAAGRAKDARRLLRELDALAATRHVDPFHAGLIHAGLGETDPAFEQLGKALSIRSPLMNMIKVLPVLDGLRADPRFEQLLQKIGLSSS